MTKRTMKTAVDFLRDAAGDSETARKLEEQLDRSVLTRKLSAMRAARKVSQKQIADLLGVNQSAVSKIEHDDDDSVTVAHIKAYAQALGFHVEIQFVPRSFTLVDRVKMFILRAAQAIQEMGRSGTGDRTISDGVRKFYGETVFNVGCIVGGLSKKQLPQASPGDKSELTLVEAEESFEHATT